MAQNKCCICYDPELDSLIYQSKKTLSKLSHEIVKSKAYGYSCDKRAEEKADLLQNYLRTLEDENRKIAIGGKPCLNCDDAQSLAEKVRRLTTSCENCIREDYSVDESMEELWIAQNPYCVSREKWEKIAYTVCRAFNIDILAEDLTKDCDITLEALSVEQACNLTFEILREIIPCDIMLAISAYNEVCDLGLTISRTEEECALDFKILKEEVDCDLSLKAYKDLIKCNLSFDIIKTVYENGCTIEVENGLIPVLSTPVDKYPLMALASGTPDLKALKKIGVVRKPGPSKFFKESDKPKEIEQGIKPSTGSNKFFVSPERFIKQLKQDYS